MIKFTDAQKLACDISRNIAVTAGAGSGKTSVLVERYVWCLRNNGYQVDRIVAITFTEKAAGEMLKRIRDRILDYAKDDIGDPERWEDVLEQLPLAPISTIHSFCQRLLREFPLAAGVDPNFEVLDETLKGILLTRLIDETIKAYSAGHHPALSTLAELWTPTTLRTVLHQLITFREKTLSWAKRILQEDFSAYLTDVSAFVEHLQRQGVERLEHDQQWQKMIALIRSAIPAGDTSKLTYRCMSVLEFDAEFRQQTQLEQKLITLGMLHKHCSLIGVTKVWKEGGRSEQLKTAFSQLKELYAKYLPPYSVNVDLEQSGFEIQHALAKVFLEVYDRYQQEKAARRVLDFDDLQECALVLLEKPQIQPAIARRYDYIMVDEFQDTNQVQWDLIQKLGTTARGFAKDKFCIVGDEKQSIYLFRGADVEVFGNVRWALKQANVAYDMLLLEPNIPPLGEKPQIRAEQRAGELIMAENFRSNKFLIFFFNYLFARLFLTDFDPTRLYDVRHQELVSSRRAQEDSQRLAELLESDTFNPVEFLFAYQAEELPEQDAEPDEPELVARRIRAMVENTHGISDGSRRWNYADIAVLIRTRIRLKEFEEALRRHQIPFVVAGGIGFYQRQEIYDLANLLRFLVDTRQDIALAGVLRSPLFSFSDDQLLYVACGKFAEDTPLPHTHQATASDNTPLPPSRGDLAQRRSEHLEDAHESDNPPLRGVGRCLPTNTALTLWQKLGDHVQSIEMIPEELDPPKFRYAFATLCVWKAQVDRIPITHLLRRILDETGLYGILAADPREIQSVINIEKLLDLARTFESQGFQSLSDFVMYLDQLTEIEEREGEAQINIEGMDVVRLMTIHAAKGLEFPVVFVPELDREFNYGRGDPVYVDRIDLHFGDAEVEKNISQAYVAAGVKGLDPGQNYAPENTVLRNYLKRLNAEKTDAEMKRLLYVACTRAQEQLILSGTISTRISKNSWLSWLMEILPLEEGISQQSLTIAEETGDAEQPHALLIPIRTAEDYQDQGQSGESKATPLEDVRKVAQLQDALAGTTSFESSPIQKLLQENLRPLKGKDNELFIVKPSALYALFACPQQYYYAHILRLDEKLLSQYMLPVEIQAQTGASSTNQYVDGMRRGTIIHKLFEEQLFDLDNEQERTAAVARILRAMNVSEHERQDMRLDAAIQRAQHSYVTTGVKTLFANASKVDREYPFQLQLGQAYITGVIDVLLFDQAKNLWTILDYKTNEVETNQIPEEVKKHGYDLQMQLYALAVSRLFQAANVHSILFFTYPARLYENIDLSQQALQKLENKLADVLKQFSAGKIQRAQKPEECEECVYRQANICLRDS